MIRRLIDRWREKRRKEAAMRRFGWDCQCSGCRRWMHAENCGRSIAATEIHWHYLCDCGELTAFALWGPVPMGDPDYYAVRLVPLATAKGESNA